MQDYHINVHYTQPQPVQRTSPRYQNIQKRTQVVSETKKERAPLFTMPTKVMATGLGGAAKINSYVGELTENNVTASRRRVGITYASMAGLAIRNPVIGFGAMGAYTLDKGIDYNINIYKSNLSAGFMRDLSGGTVKTRG